VLDNLKIPSENACQLIPFQPFQGANKLKFI
jgi:hypothetical protein